MRIFGTISHENFYELLIGKSCELLQEALDCEVLPFALVKERCFSCPKFKCESRKILVVKRIKNSHLSGLLESNSLPFLLQR